MNVLSLLQDAIQDTTLHLVVTSLRLFLAVTVSHTFLVFHELAFSLDFLTFFPHA